MGIIYRISERAMINFIKRLELKRGLFLFLMITINTDVYASTGDTLIGEIDSISLKDSKLFIKYLLKNETIKDIKLPKEFDCPPSTLSTSDIFVVHRISAEKKNSVKLKYTGVRSQPIVKPNNIIVASSTILSCEYLVDFAYPIKPVEGGYYSIDFRTDYLTEEGEPIKLRSKSFSFEYTNEHGVRIIETR